MLSGIIIAIAIILAVGILVGALPFMTVWTGIMMVLFWIMVIIAIIVIVFFVFMVWVIWVALHD